MSQPSTPPCILFEDEHLLVVNKPCGWNTHAPAPDAGEGIYDWLRHREPRWASLAIIHRLDKETSGVMLFAKSKEANRSLTAQFSEREVKKVYQLLTEGVPQCDAWTSKSNLARDGERYREVSGAAGETAVTEFQVLRRETGKVLMEARPLTGRTHQIRVHAAAAGLPILGDGLYGGSPAARVCLHAVSLELKHPVSGEALRFEAPADFAAEPRQQLRAAIIEPELTNAYRVIHGAADGWPGWYVDRLGDWLMSQGEGALAPSQQARLEQMTSEMKLRGAYHKNLSRQVRRMARDEASPQRVAGEAAAGPFTILENGLRYELGFAEGYSVGIFLDQRDNRRRLLTNHVAAGFTLLPGGMAGAEVLNAFAYTCGFSVAAAAAGARTTSLDLSRKYLDWGRRNLGHNNIDPAAHDFIYGDAFDWMRRLAKKARKFDIVVVDPPTFSQSKQTGVFQAERDFGKLVEAVMPLLKPGGVLLASTNAAKLTSEKFLQTVREAVRSCDRKVTAEHYVPQPVDFPIHRDEPAYLKTCWLRVG